MSSQKFSLKWNDFERNVSNSFSQLRQKTRLHDVTLVSSDHHPVPAHKLVLSACSEVFSTIFNNNNSSNMMLYLDSVDRMEINFILDYIYQGEVEIEQEYLDRFLEIATKFKLSGLIKDESGAIDDSQYRPRADENMPVEVDCEDNNQDYKKKEPKHVEERSVRPMNQIFVSNVAEFEEKFAELVEKKEGGCYLCTVCKKEMNVKRDMKRHLETHLSGLSYECLLCNKSFRSSNALRHHDDRFHA